MTEMLLDTIHDFAKMTPEQFQRMLPDFAAWHAFTRLAMDAGAESSRFRWIDDGKPGVINSVSVTIKETGEEITFNVEDL